MSPSISFVRASLSKLLLAAALLGAPACLLQDDDSDMSGRTECGDFASSNPFEKSYCNAGEYCANASFSDCAPGCLSNQNCADDQRCVKADGTHVGSCQNESKHPASEPRPTVPDLPTLPKGATACGTYMGELIACQPGQFCEDQRFNLCELGCLSNLNCAEEQTCVKPEGQDIGSCR